MKKAERETLGALLHLELLLGPSLAFDTVYSQDLTSTPTNHSVKQFKISYMVRRDTEIVFYHKAFFLPKKRYPSNIIQVKWKWMKSKICRGHK